MYAIKSGITLNTMTHYEDAKASAHILLEAIQIAGTTIDSFLRIIDQPIDRHEPHLHSSKTHNRNALQATVIRSEVNPQGNLFGQVVVFTGDLEMPRQEAADLAASIGCRVGSSVTKKTTILVVGEQDISKFAGKEKSNKQLKAEFLISQGKNIRTINELEFMELVNQSKLL